MIASVRSKANRNERLARTATIAIVLASALIPVSLIISTQGQPFFWGKLLPSLLASVAAVGAGVIQLERPHERWKIYRGYQRALEAERFRYENKLAPYEIDGPESTRTFAAAIVSLQQALHQEWSGLLPPSADIVAAGSSPIAGR
jgi:hypothetical protein